MTDEQFVANFENSTLDTGSFHHADHVRMGFLYLRHYPALEALQRFSTSLIRLTAKSGRPDLYNETITWAFLLLIRERMVRAGRQQTWAEFSASNEDLMTKTSVLKKYYREETLSSPLAKSTFLFPDKIWPVGK